MYSISAVYFTYCTYMGALRSRFNEFIYLLLYRIYSYNFSIYR